MRVGGTGHLEYPRGRGIGHLEYPRGVQGIWTIPGGYRAFGISQGGTGHLEYPRGRGIQGI